MKLKEQLDNFYTRYNIPKNGGEDEKFFIVPLSFFNLKLPNFAWRKRMLHVHDLEHILNNQDTTWKGEIFIASWEIATGFWRYFPVCIFPFWAMGLGLWKHPHAIYRGFMKGCRDRGIASLNMSKSEILEYDLLQLKDLVEGKAPKHSQTFYHFLLYLFSCVGELVFFSPLIVLLLLFFIISS